MNMVFSSMVFLSCALPIVLGIYYLLPHKWLWVRNLWLTLFSLLFYAWGEPGYVLLMIVSIFINYASAKLLCGFRRKAAQKACLTLNVIFNIGMLVVFKYLSLFIGSVNVWFGLTLPDPNLALPIGISFYTFQAMSYVIDVYRDRDKLESNPLNVALYVSLFPQLIAGPIVRFDDVRTEIRQRTESMDSFALGMERFIVGLGKKVLIANVLGEVADGAFAIGGELSASAAWLGLICYAGQIFYDFSGYSDMGIGLGHMFGFKFPENFLYPYAATSMKSFWNRWHITLNTWFRDYVYIPLGGRNENPRVTARNLFIVFCLTGLWHGASWTFLAWGIFHGVFRIIEELIPRKAEKKTWLGHLYVLGVVLAGWVLFRSDNFAAAFAYYKSLLGWGGIAAVTAVSSRTVATLCFAAIGAIGFFPAIMRLIHKWRFTKHIQWIFLTTILFLSLLSLSSSTYNPFIYFRF